jgi:hypothetical protein
MCSLVDQLLHGDFPKGSPCPAYYRSRFCIDRRIGCASVLKMTLSINCCTVIFPKAHLVPLTTVRGSVSIVASDALPY